MGVIRTVDGKEVGEVLEAVEVLVVEATTSEDMEVALASTKEGVHYTNPMAISLQLVHMWGAISRMSTKQDSVANSSCYAEYHALNVRGKDVM